MGLEDKKWPLWSKKEGKKTWEMMHEARFSCKEIRTQKFDGIYTLTLRTNLEYFLKTIIYILYIVSKHRKSGVQRFKRFANRSWNEEVMNIWRQLHQVGGSFRNDFKIQLMNSKSTSKWHQFRIHPLPLWCSASSTPVIASIQLMNSKWHQCRIHPLTLWCFASSTSGIASKAFHPP